MSSATVTEITKRAHATAKEKGWWDEVNLASAVDTGYVVPEKIALIHSEASEALEDYRKGQMGVYRDGGKPCGFGVELADIIIRTVDLAEALGIDIEYCINIKMAYNETRPYRHGGKKA